MAELTSEQFEQLPEFIRGDYEKDGDLYRPVAEGKLKAVKSSMNALDEKLKATSTRLEEFESSQAEKIKQAREEALAEARTKGDVAAIEKRYQEQMDDLQRRHGETLEKQSARLKEYTKKDKALISSEACKALGVFDDSEGVFLALISDRIEINPDTGSVTFLDKSGGATSLDKAGFIAELEKDPSYYRLRKAKANRGGDANGNNGNGGGASIIMSRADFEALPPKERASFMKQGGKLKD